MAINIKDSGKKILDYFREMEKAQRIRLLILAVVVILIIIVASLFLSNKTYVALYNNLDPTEAGEILQQLQEMGVDAKAEGHSTILVEDKQADTVRMQLAAKGYPKTGILSYDTFQNASGLGSTEMEKKVYWQLQLAENLSKTIRVLDKVDNAIVNLSLATQGSFVLSKDEKPASASVLLQLKAGQKLTNDEARAIAELVRAGVSGLALENISIVDDKMTLYDLAGGSDSVDTSDRMELQQSVQANLQRQITNLLSPVFGEGHVKAAVNVVLDFDTRVEESLVFNPPVEGSEEGIVISMKEMWEVIRGGDTEGGVTGFDPNGAAPQYPEVVGDQDALYTTVSREANYQLNETKTLIEKAKGTVKELTVAVLIDSEIEVDDYSENVSNLIEMAVGVPEDKISVERLPFMEDTSLAEATAAQAKALEAAHTADLIKLIVIVVASLIVLFLLFLMVKTFKRKEEAAIMAEAMQGQEIDVTADEQILPDGPTAEETLAFVEKEDTSLALLENYIESSPESVAQLLRNWLTENE